MLEVEILTSGDQSWYREAIGERFNVNEEMAGNYYIVPGRDRDRYIWKEDVKVISGFDKEDENSFYMSFHRGSGDVSVPFDNLEVAIGSARQEARDREDSVYVLKAIRKVNIVFAPQYTIETLTDSST